MMQKPQLAILLVLAAFLGLGFYQTITFPLTEGPDEAAHFLFSRFIAAHHRLPLTPEERAEAGYKSDWPPLFHGLVGLAGAGIDVEQPPFVKITQDTPRLQLVVGHENIISWRAITTADPYRGEVLLWRLGRWVALLAGAVSIYLVYRLVRGFYPAAPWLAVTAAAGLAFVPTYLNVSSVVNYESLLGATLAGYFLLLLHTLNHPDNNRTYFGLGLLLGAALLTKFTPLPLVPILPGLIVLLAYRYGWSRLMALQRIGLFGLGIALAFGPWLIFTEVYFNQVAELGWIQGLLRPFADQSDETSTRVLDALSGDAAGGLASLSIGRLGAWFWRIFQGMWGTAWLAWLFLGLLLLAALGLGRRWRTMPEADRWWMGLLGLHLAALSSLPLLRFLITSDLNTAMGQHILFPAGAALIFMLVYGLNCWLSRRQTGGVLLAVAVLGAGHLALSLGAREPSTWPIQTVPLAVEEPTLATFAEVTLLDVEIAPGPHQLLTTLVWRADETTPADYQVELTLLDGDRVPQAQWFGSPFNGRYPTRAWQPGDRLRDTIPLPVAWLPAGPYSLTLRMFNQSRQISAQPGDEVYVDDQGRVALAGLDLSPQPLEGAETIELDNQEIGFKVWPSLPWPSTQSTADGAVFGEYATVLVLTTEMLGPEVRISLLDPAGNAYPATRQAGRTHNFQVEPQFASGPYALRFEAWAGEQITATAETGPLIQVETQPRQYVAGPISRPTSANFADQMTLLGYDLPQRRAQAGGVIPVTLYWQALQSIGADLITFNQLVDDQGQVWGGRDRRPRDIYSTMLWAPGEVVADSFTVAVDPATPNGIYYLHVGAYLPVGESYLTLPVMADGTYSEVTSVSIGPIKIGEAPADLVQTGSQPRRTLDQPFGDGPDLTLLGFDLTDETGRPITNNQLPVTDVHLTLYWQSDRPLLTDYTTFVHLRDESGVVVAQKDQPPLNGAYPTSLWDAGEVIVDNIVVSLPEELPQGEYKLIVGMYNFLSEQRLMIPNHPADELELIDLLTNTR